MSQKKTLRKLSAEKEKEEEFSPEGAEGGRGPRAGAPRRGPRGRAEMEGGGTGGPPPPPPAAPAPAPARPGIARAEGKLFVGGILLAV